MSDRVVVLPSGRFVVRETDREPTDDTPLDAGLAKLYRVLAVSIPAGMFQLAAQRCEFPLSPELAYLQSRAATYMTTVCHMPQVGADSLPIIDPPPEDQLVKDVAAAPPMTGGEYLTTDSLRLLWRELDDWMRDQAQRHKRGVVGFLLENAPLWHQVGRVAFHLAENKRDPLYPFAFLATYIPGVSSGNTRVQYQPLSKALEQYAGTRDKPALVRLLSPIQQASEKSEFVRELVESGDIYHPLAWTPGEAHRFLRECSLYEESGILVRLPDWWQKRSRPQVRVTIGDDRQKKLDSSTLLDFDVSLALGDQTLSKMEWQDLLATDESLVFIKGQWVEVDQAKLTSVLDHWRSVEQASRDGSISFIDGMRLLAGAPSDLDLSDDGSGFQQEWSYVHAGDWLGDVLKSLRNPNGESSLKVSSNLNATLRPYQEKGVAWLRMLTELGLGACLADDMGLGKTLQVLTLLLQLKEQGGRRKPKPSLVVLPASLLANWKSEMARFVPTLTPMFVHPSEANKETMAQWSTAGTKSLANVDVVLTTYGMLTRQPWLSEVEWRLVVLDEAQAIKNPGVRQTRTVKKLKAEARIALTGTPVENRVSDLWSLFDFLCPGLLGSAATFKKFVKALNDREHGRYTPLRNLVQPYILRRMKTDKSIIADLPDKTEVQAYCGLSKRQAVLYQKSVTEMTEMLKKTGHDDGIKRRGLVLSYLMRFKQICNHPSQLVQDGSYDPADSGKFTRLAEICDEIASRQEKALIFTQFRQLAEPLRDYLTQVFGRAGLILHGGTAVGRRKALVDQFQREEGPPFFVLSLKAGGTGLNLTAASHVIHFDRWWNPAVENQATDRAFRIGQKRNVLVHKFVCRGTIEERIDELIQAKQSLADDLLTGGAEKMLTEMTDRELLDLVALDINKAL